VNADTREEIEALLHAGLSDLAIHQQTGAARATVARHRKRLGLPGYQTTPDSPTCRHGHPFPENLSRNEKGHLVCVACRRAHWRRRDAALRMWSGPDEVAIERAAAGDPPERLTPRERRAAIALLDRQQLPAAVIAERVGCSQRTVHRARAAA
jgi:hypothetical protein